MAVLRVFPRQRLGFLLQAFHKGFGPFFQHLTDPDFLHAVRAYHCLHSALQTPRVLCSADSCTGTIGR